MDSHATLVHEYASKISSTVGSAAGGAGIGKRVIVEYVEKRASRALLCESADTVDRTRIPSSIEALDQVPAHFNHDVRRYTAAAANLADRHRPIFIPGLREIRKTAPYFHNNSSAATLEEVVDHHIEFFKLVQANTVPGAPSNHSRRPTVCTSIGEQRPTSALIAYLRKP